MSTGLQVMVVEDDPFYQSFYSDSFGEGTHLTFCDRVELALKINHYADPHLVLIDYNLPDGLGTDVIKAIREKNRANPPYIVLITSLGDTQVHEAALKAGANRALVKPVSANEFENIRAAMAPENRQRLIP